MKCFHAKQFANKDELCQLAKSLNSSERKIRDWFSDTSEKTIAEGMLIEGE